MMINLFSSFDPSTSQTLSLNWLSILYPFIFLPMCTWTTKSHHNIPFSMLVSMISSELKSMNMNKPSGIMILSISILFIIIISNSVGLLPYTFTSTSHLIITLPLALTIWMSLMLFGWVNQTKHMLAHMLPVGTPSPLMFFMVCIESISLLIRPITLSVRLTANMIAGHLLISLISTSMSHCNMTVMLPMLGTELTLLILETAVAAIQGYVFMTLVMLYSTETMASN